MTHSGQIKIQRLLIITCCVCWVIACSDSGDSSGQPDQPNSFLCVEPISDQAPGVDGCITFDLGRHKLIFVGGDPFQTWEWEDDHWIRIETAHTPGSMVWLEIEYFPPEQRTILIGIEYNYYVSQPDIQIWAYDGLDWTQIGAPHDSLEPLGHFVYDPDNLRLIYTGGCDGTTGNSLRDMDLYLYSDEQWQQIKTSVIYKYIVSFGLEYDRTRDRIVLPLSHRNGNIVYNETYELIDYEWVLVNESAGPSGPLIYDEKAEALFSFSETFVYPHYRTGVYRYDHGDWILVDDPVSVSSIDTATYNRETETTVLFEKSFTWSFSAEQGWSDITSPRFPLNFEYGTAAFFPDQAAVVMVVSSMYPVHRDETWFWDGNECFSRSTSLETLGFGKNKIVYDPLLKRLIMMVYGNGTNQQLRVWEYPSELDDWRVLPESAAGPLSVSFWAITYYPDVQSVMLFGRADYYEGESQTWLFKDNAWQQFWPESSPPSRRSGSMVYNENNHTVLLFGGVDEYCYNDTWEFDGLDWRQIETENAPTFRESAAMVFEKATGKIVLTGGNCGAEMFDDVWEFYEGNWQQRNVSGADTTRTNAAFAYDEFRDRIVIWGGMSGLETRGSLLELSRSVE